MARKLLLAALSFGAFHLIWRVAFASGVAAHSVDGSLSGDWLAAGIADKIRADIQREVAGMQ